MEPTSIILVVTISNLIIQPLLSYILHSRCTKIETPCCKIERTVKEMNETSDHPTA